MGNSIGLCLGGSKEKQNKNLELTDLDLENQNKIEKDQSHDQNHDQKIRVITTPEEISNYSIKSSSQPTLVPSDDDNDHSESIQHPTIFYKNLTWAQHQAKLSCAYGPQESTTEEYSNEESRSNNISGQISAKLVNQDKTFSKTDIYSSGIADCEEMVSTYSLASTNYSNRVF